LPTAKKVSAETIEGVCKHKKMQILYNI